MPCFNIGDGTYGTILDTEIQTKLASRPNHACVRKNMSAHAFQ